MAKKIMSSQTESESAKVVFTSAVGTSRHSCRPSAPRIFAMMSTGRKSIAFISSTQMKTVSAAGATKRLRSP